MLYNIYKVNLVKLSGCLQFNNYRLPIYCFLLCKFILYGLSYIDTSKELGPSLVLKPVRLLINKTPIRRNKLKGDKNAKEKLQETGCFIYHSSLCIVDLCFCICCRGSRRIRRHTCDNFQV